MTKEYKYAVQMAGASEYIDGDDNLHNAQNLAIRYRWQLAQTAFVIDTDTGEIMYEASK